MKRTILIIASTMLSLSVYAEDWMLIHKDSTGLDLVINVESVTITKSEDGIPVVAALFRNQRDNLASDSFALITNEVACKNMKGQMFYRTYVGNKWVTTHVGEWSRKGVNAHDYAGRTLCGLYTYSVNHSHRSKPSV